MGVAVQVQDGRCRSQDAVVGIGNGKLSSVYFCYFPFFLNLMCPELDF